MKPDDFLRCTFNGDTTKYVARITSVSPGSDSFDCVFVHSGKGYTFSSSNWTVLKSNGGFSKGTELTSYQIFTPGGTSLSAGSYVGVTFADNRKYLGVLTSMDPSRMVTFLHSGKIYSFDKDNTITLSSSDIYRKGQSIKAIDVYILEFDSHPQTDFTPVISFDPAEYHQQFVEDIKRLFSPDSGSVSADRIKQIIDASKINNNINPSLSQTARETLLRNATAIFERAISSFQTSVDQLKHEIETEMQEEKEMAKFWLEIFFAIAIPAGVAALPEAVTATLSAASGLAKETVEKGIEFSLDKTLEYPAVEDAFLSSQTGGVGYLQMLGNVAIRYSNYYIQTFNIKDNTDLATIIALFENVDGNSYIKALKELAEEYVSQVESGNELALIRLTDDPDSYYLARVYQSEGFVDTVQHYVTSYVTNKFQQMALKNRDPYSLKRYPYDYFGGSSDKRDQAVIYYGML